MRARVGVLAALAAVVVVRLSNRLAHYERLLPRVLSRVNTQVHRINQP